MSSEKEINVYLFEQLRIVEHALALARKENSTETISYLEEEKHFIELKLYQNPPLENK